MTNKIIVGGLVAIMLTSCMTQKRLDRICRLCPDEVRTERKDSIVFKETFVDLPGETIHDTIRIECDERNKPQIVGSRKQKKGKRKPNQPNLDQDFKKVSDNTFVNICEVDSQQVAIQWYENHSKETVSTTVKVSDSRRFNDFFYFMGVAFSLLLLLLLLIIIPKIFHKYL